MKRHTEPAIRPADRTVFERKDRVKKGFVPAQDIVQEQIRAAQSSV